MQSHWEETINCSSAMSRKKTGRKNAMQLKNETVIIRIKRIFLKVIKSDRGLDQQKCDKMGASVRGFILRKFLEAKCALKSAS